jgi:TM2 domain-containing membrane protein YozV
MRKALILLLAFVVLSTQSFGATAVIFSEKPLYDIGYGVKLTAEQILTLTPKKYKKLTGHKLGLRKSIALKIVQKKITKNPSGEAKSQLIALLLVLSVGGLGIHRFYLGYTWQGIVQLLTLGGLGIWVLIDMIRIITGDLKPKNDEYGTTL